MAMMVDLSKDGHVAVHRVGERRGYAYFGARLVEVHQISLWWTESDPVPKYCLAVTSDDGVWSNVKAVHESRPRIDWISFLVRPGEA